ncbi:hypothetical protein CcaverHIS002_0302800 [Cutaneotrichosporon cavernicola]|uniref:BZIP domain-containing protein n=1 Tax=Cutaneotrichosporon cavernicola TaxID=279322 RepID=A0AA48IF53_9TREE|nr:uncharacterized protein CcaverHIS019_0302810 [Cutaneotrichosporon cavernicola]BEI82412.1 hypothetical protein CcaverHIS002_0302800 [Cutaneotrichosporon cavernicola]BEI90211.1 hypothetical protein CcaverHIS019_0302810 [Cutaneotrichosporon cavernicola]BEI97990.1 hypothetical protein CcaverHIS631_0302890 [Cutaneotrichosporon cavernicola]BEJ05766.1 hypothetical protein CcaverHIS641_0302880 [Cutaneotrichosporon cavernicola]
MEALSAQPPFNPVGDKTANLLQAQNMASAWSSYLYQNQNSFMPGMNNQDWLLGLGSNAGNAPGNTQGATASGAAPAAGTDLFPTWAPTQPTDQNQFLMNMDMYGGSIAPSLLGARGVAHSTGSGTPTTIASSLDLVDKIVASPSPIGCSPGRHSNPDSDADGEVDPEADTRSNHSHHSHESVHEHDEGVERDGMIWGMKVDQYRALSARERKRVRNRISARTFRAKRKEHLSSLESTLGTKDLEIKMAHQEMLRLRRQVADLQRRLAKYEAPTF